jgi:hypothetical protein
MVWRAERYLEKSTIMLSPRSPPGNSLKTTRAEGRGGSPIWVLVLGAYPPCPGAPEALAGHGVYYPHIGGECDPGFHPADLRPDRTLFLGEPFSVSNPAAASCLCNPPTLWFINSTYCPETELRYIYRVY